MGARLLAADSLDSAAALQWVEYWLNWFAEREASAITGILAGATEAETTLEILYFDGPGSDDWPALAPYRGSFVPAFGRDHVFIPQACL